MNPLFFAQNKPILEDMKIIDIPSGEWGEVFATISDGLTENLILPPKYNSWSDFILDYWKDSYVYEDPVGFLYRISNCILRVFNPSYEILFPICLNRILNSTDLPSTLEYVRGIYNSSSGTGGAYQVYLNILYGEGTIKFVKVNS